LNVTDSLPYESVNLSLPNNQMQDRMNIDDDECMAKVLLGRTTLPSFPSLNVADSLSKISLPFSRSSYMDYSSPLMDSVLANTLTIPGRNIPADSPFPDQALLGVNNQVAASH
jgi:hypothetical protein